MNELNKLQYFKNHAILLVFVKHLVPFVYRLYYCLRRNVAIKVKLLFSDPVVHGLCMFYSFSV